MIHFDGPTIYFRDGLNLNVVAEALVLSLPRKVARKVLCDELRKVVSLFLHVIHTQLRKNGK